MKLLLAVAFMSVLCVSYCVNLHEKCTVDSNCTAIDGAMCHKMSDSCTHGMCMCKENYMEHADKKTCLEHVMKLKVGDACTDGKSKCPWNSECKSDKCVCMADHMRMDNMEWCYKNGSVATGKNCTGDAHCMTMNSKCIDEKCGCKELFMNKDGMCMSHPRQYGGGVCENKDHCEKNMVCTEKKCACATDFEAVDAIPMGMNKSVIMCFGKDKFMKDIKMNKMCDQAPKGDAKQNLCAKEYACIRCPEFNDTATSICLKPLMVVINPSGSTANYYVFSTLVSMVFVSLIL